MVLINGKEIKVYELDTDEIFIRRVASMYSTLPKYLVFQGGVPKVKEIFYDQSTNIIVENIIDTIISYKDSFFDEFYTKNNIKDKIEQQNLNIINDILMPYIYYNNVLKDLPSEYKNLYLLDNIQKIIPGITIQKIEELSNKNLINELEENIKNNKIKAEKEFNIIKNIDVESINSTDFELEKVTFKIQMNIDDLDLNIQTLFNLIKLNKNVPFASFKQYYKIFNESNAVQSWMDLILDDDIILKVLEDDSKLEYTDVVISNDNKKIYIELEVNIPNNIATTYDLSNLPNVKNILNILKTAIVGKNIVYSNIVENNINGVFYFPKQKLNKYVLSDLIMNDDIFSNIMVIDESIKASKQKPSIFIYFNSEILGEVRINITEKVMEKTDQTMKGKNLDIFPIKQKFVRVKITKTDSIKTAIEFKKLLSKLFTIYNTKSEGIVNIYKSYIPDFDTEVIYEKPEEAIDLRDIAPDIFLSNYSRNCRYIPTILSEKDEIPEDKKSIVFPNNNISKQHTYVCNHKEHIFPGLRNNPFSNKDKFPYLPCCYKKDQEKIKGSKYNHYYHGETLITKNIKQQNIITTNKILSYKPIAFGTLPYDISTLFDLFDSSLNTLYIRKGIFRSTSSFLSCILDALNLLPSLEYDEEMEAYLNNTRDNLLKNHTASLCKQEMYDYSHDEIVKIINDYEAYMDPKLFIHLLEVKYNCNIFIFSRNDINGEMIIPRHIGAYYKIDSSKPCIFIFEHNGSESDYAKYPQCELITKWDTSKKAGDKDSLTYVFDFDSDISKGMFKVFNELKLCYSLDKEIINIDLPLIYNNKIKIISQYIDSYGKTRILNVEYKSQKFTLITSPIQPINVIEDNEINIFKNDLKISLEFASEINMSILKQIINKDLVNELYGKLGNVIVKLPVIASKIIMGVPTDDSELIFPINETSISQQYNKNKRLARYITEYILWLYSKYININDIKFMTDESIVNFVNENIIVINNFKYDIDNFSSTFSINPILFVKNKLVLSSEELLKRLIYVLRLEIIRNNTKIINYHTKTNIDSFYEDISDFTIYSQQVLLSRKSFEQWIDKKQNSLTLYNYVLDNTPDPYFFKNNLINNKVYLAQNTYSFAKAVDICIQWHKNNYNIKISNIEDIDEYEENFYTTLYSYVNRNDIKPYIINKNLNSKYHLLIIGYKINDVSMFTSLLPL